MTTTTTAYASFSRPCLDCGHTISVINGVEQPHTCEAPEDRRQLVAQAYWQGHDAAAAPISPEAFMAQPPDPEEELDAQQAAPRLNALTIDFDPLASIAGSLAALVRMAEQNDEAERLSDSLRERYDDLDAKAGELYALLEEIEAIIKPSTSKLANQVRETISRWRDPEVPAAAAEEPGAGSETPEHPSHDAPVEEWRDFAKTMAPPYNWADIDTMNRSQIRSMLGIPQPGTPVAPSVVHS